MRVEPNDQLLKEISIALLKKDLRALEPLCLNAIDSCLKSSDWNALLEATILYGKTLRIKSVYSGNKSLINKAFEQFEKGKEYFDKVDKPELKTSLILETAITLIQTKEFESAEKLLNELDCLQSQNEKIKIKCLNTKCLLKAQQFKFDEALKYADKALNLAKILGETEPLNNSYRSVGMVYCRQHNFSKIPEIFNLVLTHSNKIGDVEGKMISYNNIAVFNASVANYKIALENFLASYELASFVGFRTHSARCLVNIGAIFSQLDNFELAIDHFERVMDDYGEVIDINTKAVILINLGEIYIKQDRLQDATNTIRTCLDYSIQENYQQFICLSYHHLGKIELKKGDSEKALEHALKAKELFEQLGEVNGKEENLIVLAESYKLKGENQMALACAIEGVELAEKLENYGSIANGNDLIAEILSSSKQFEEAFNYQKSAVQAHKKMLEQKNSKALLDLEIQYDTKQKEREIQLLKSTNKIQEQLIEKQREFELQNELLVQTNEELKQFTYAVSHDLREPVRMIESYIQILKNKYSDTWNDEQHEFFHYVSDGAVRMRSLLKDLLEYATLGGNIIQDQSWFSLEKIVHSVELDLSLKIQEANATVLIENDVQLFTNKNMFRLIIQNLISNAIKFRKDDVDPIITVDAKKIGPEVVISINDNGIGIEEIYQDKIFRLFHRIHSKEKYNGTGIGLALCAKIIRMMEGKINLKSILGEQTTFILRFPIAKMVLGPSLVGAHKITG